MAGGGHAEASVDVALPFVLIALLAGVLIRQLRKYLPKAANPPYTVILFLFGLGLTAISSALNMARVTRSIDMWLQVHPHIILLVFLPPLLFESAFDMDYNVFQRVAGQALLLAVPGVLLALGLTALYIYAFFGAYGWGWDMALLLGSILAATDPVAVVAVLKTLGAPARLASLVEGESLLNDGSAFVLFLIFKDFASGTHQTAGGVIGSFFQLSLGGPAFGLLIAWVAYGFLYFVYNDPHVEVTGVIVCVFGVFMLAELSLAVSSVLAVVVFGLFFAKQGKYALSREVHHTSHSIWAEIGYVSNTLVFTLSGLIFFKEVFLTSDMYADPWNWALLLISYVMLHVVRVVVIALLYPFMRNMGYGLSIKECAVMAFGGLRGAVGLALGLLVDLETGNISQMDKTRLNFHVAGIVFLTLLINGTAAGAFYRWVQPYPGVSKFKVRLVEKALDVLQVEVQEETEALKHRWYFKDTRWGLVDNIVPPFNKMTYENGRLDAPMESIGQCFKQDRVVRLWGAGIANARLAARGSKDGTAAQAAAPPQNLAADLMVSGMVNTVMSALHVPSPAAGQQDHHKRDEGGDDDDFDADECDDDVEKMGAGVPRERLAQRKTEGLVATASPGFAVFQEGKERRASLAEGNTGAGSGAGSGLAHEEGSGHLSIHAMQSLKHFNVHKRDEVCQIVFTTVKAYYHAMYEDRYLDSSAMLVLIDSLDKGHEAARTTQDTRHTAIPITTAWQCVKKEIYHTKFMTKWCLQLPTTMSWTRALRAVFEYSHVKRAMEALHAYIEAHESILSGGDYRSTLDPVVTKEIAATVADARKELEAFKAKNDIASTVLIAVMAAKVVLNSMRGKIMHLYHEEGMLDEKIKNQLVETIEARMYQLHAFFPSPFVLGLKKQERKKKKKKARTSTAKPGNRIAVKPKSPAPGPLANAHPVPLSSKQAVIEEM